MSEDYRRLRRDRSQQDVFLISTSSETEILKPSCSLLERTEYADTLETEQTNVPKVLKC